MQKSLGWNPQLKDIRDLKYRDFRVERSTPLPPSVDMRAHAAPVLDQLQLGSCTANAISVGLDFQRQRQHLPMITPSRLMIYYDERVIEGTVATDNGANIRDGLHSVLKQGACPESDWPYDPSKFTERPPDSAYAIAAKDLLTRYVALDGVLDDLKDSLVGGLDFVFGISVYESFMSDSAAATGMIPMPGQNEQLDGGHALFCLGYDDSINGGSFIFQNSWNTSWGDRGFGYLPYEYMNQLGSDFWSMHIVEA